MVLLPSMWDLPEEIKLRFGDRSSGKQRAMVHDEHLLLVLHQLPKDGEDEREAIFFWRQPSGDWQFSGRGQGLPSLSDHLTTFEQAEDELRQGYREAVDAEDYFHLLERLAPIHHAAKNLYGTLQSARDGVPEDRDIIDLRDWAYDIERDLDLLYRDSKNALDFSMARKAEEQAFLGDQAVKSGHRLNVLAAVFFPLAAVSGLFGMNLRHGLEDSPVAVFWVVLLVGVLIGLGIARWILR